MKNIKLFEEFDDYLSDTKVKWADAPFWVEELYPEELCYLALYSERLKIKGKEYFIPVYCTIKDRDYDLLGYSSNGGIEANFEIFLNIPSKEDKSTVSYDVEASGYIRGGDPDFPGESELVLSEVNLENIYYLNSDESLEVNFKGNYEFKSDIVDNDMLLDLMEYVAECKISYDESKTNNGLPDFPDELIKKCEEIRKNHSSSVRGTGILKRFSSF
jgi:hypothetical protein